jgi:transposase
VKIVAPLNGVVIQLSKINQAKCLKKEQLMNYYAGLEISMKETVICIVDEKGKIIHKGRSKTDVEKIIHHLLCTKLKIEKIGLESGSTSYWLVKNLNERGFPAICVGSRKMAAILSMKENKTDDNDAQGIAEAIRCGMYH